MLTFVTKLFKPSEPKPPAPMTSETGMVFATQEVAAFLTQLGNNPRFGLPAELAQEVQRGLDPLAEGEARRWKLTCDLDRQPILFEIRAVMEEAAAPELTFFSTQDAVQEIERELEAFAAAKGR